MCAMWLNATTMGATVMAALTPIMEQQTVMDIAVVPIEIGGVVTMMIVTSIPPPCAALVVEER